MHKLLKVSVSDYTVTHIKNKFNAVKMEEEEAAGQRQ